jgi:hypothetical protein
MTNNIPLNDYLLAHCNESMERALAAERHPAWQRSCPEMNDIDFIRLGLLRCISVVDSGRHFLQTTEEIHGELLPHSTYFKSLKSSRRASMLEAIERQSYVKQRGKIARESGKQRRKLSTPICVMIRYFAGETLGVIYGFYCRNQKASFYKR